MWLQYCYVSQFREKQEVTRNLQIRQIGSKLRKPSADLPVTTCLPNTQAVMKQTSKALAYAAQETTVRQHSRKQILLLCPAPKYHQNVFIFHHWESAVNFNTVAQLHKLEWGWGLTTHLYCPGSKQVQNEVCLSLLFSLKIQKLHHWIAEPGLRPAKPFCLKHLPFLSANQMLSLWSVIT